MNNLPHDTANHQPAPTDLVFKCRAECMADVGRLLQRIAAERVVVEAILIPLPEQPGYEGAYAGEEVTLTGPHVGRCPLGLDELRTIVAEAEEGAGVMVDTLAPLTEYTGKRVHRGEPAAAPPAPVVAADEWPPVGSHAVH